METFKKTFPQCPACGSEERFCESLANELKDRGLTRPEWTFTYDTREGAVVDKKGLDKLPIGTELAIYRIKTDVCLNCGCLYAIMLEKDKTKVEAKPKLLMPEDMNRAARRRLERGGQDGFN